MEPLRCFESEGTESPTAISISSFERPTEEQQPSELHNDLESLGLDLSNIAADYLLDKGTLELPPTIKGPKKCGDLLGSSKGKTPADRLTEVDNSPPVAVERLTTYSVFPRVPNLPLGRSPLQRTQHRDTCSFRTSTVPRHKVTIVMADGPAPLTTKIVSPVADGAIAYPAPAMSRGRTARETYPGHGPLVSGNCSNFSPIMWSPSWTNSLERQSAQPRSTRRLTSSWAAGTGLQEQQRYWSDSVAGPAVPSTGRAQIQHSRVPDRQSCARRGTASPVPVWPLPGPAITQPGSASLANHARQVQSTTSPIAGPSSITHRPCHSQPGSIGDCNAAAPRSPYITMLQSIDKIPRMHNILASVFTWVLLAGFVVFPATFSWPPPGSAVVLQQYCLVGLAGALSALGVLGMAAMGWRWRNNYVWLLNRIFLPGALNGLAGLLATAAAIYAAQIHGVPRTQVWTPPVMSAVCFAGAAFLVCSVMFVIYSRILLRKMKLEYERELEKGTQAARKGSDNSQCAAYPKDGNVPCFNGEHEDS